MKILTAAEMQRIDRLTTEQFGVPSLTLMDNAGRGVVEVLEKRYSPLSEHQVLILCGRGNNGGDGLVVARLLRERGLKPRTVLLADPAKVKGDAAVNLERLTALEPPEVAADPVAWRSLKPQLRDSTLVIDALLGTGLSKPLEGFLLEVVRDINTDFPRAKVVAVDLPSGVSADTGELPGESVHAHTSVTFTAPKVAHVFPPASERAGDWETKLIGTPREALEQDPALTLNLTSPEELGWLTRARKPDAHKGNFGHVLVLAGSVGKTGAAAMAGLSALRAGAGLVTIATAKSALAIIACLGFEFMTEPLPETEAGTISLRAFEHGRLDSLVEGKSVLAIGPGIGTALETAELVRTAVNRYDLPVVVDADGLNAFSHCMSVFRSAGGYEHPAVLTPHPGEMSRLSGEPTSDIQSRRLEAARDFARRYNVHLVLKGFRTLTASPEGQVWVNPTGNPGMATGGTGDVLTGLAAGLLAQHRRRRPAEVVAAAVYLHGLAGDLAARKFGEASMIAGDVIHAIPEAFAALATNHAS
jgi:ADP-dependent NAD(P)H-hydrate dehydratase / NAD(P)H-hydrate epimerase